MCANGYTSEEEELERMEEEQNYDVEIKKIVSEIKVHQESLHKINVLSSEEIFEVEEMYNKLRKPKYEKRTEIISKIPDFWANVFLNHPHIKSILYAEEEDCLYYLTKFEVEESEDVKSGYTLKFFFKENPYFENEILIKKRNLDLCGKKLSLRTIINWKDHYFAEKLRKHNKSRKMYMEAESFFGWLTDNSNPVQDYTAEVIKYEIWRMPLLYFSTDYLFDDNEVRRLGDNEDMDVEEEEEEEQEEEEEYEYMDTEEEGTEDGITEEEEVEICEDEITGTKEAEVEECEDGMKGAKEEEVEECEDGMNGAKEEEVEECEDGMRLTEEEEVLEYEDGIRAKEEEEVLEYESEVRSSEEEEEEVFECEDEIRSTEEEEVLECENGSTKEEEVEECEDAIRGTEEEEIKECKNTGAITEEEKKEEVCDEDIIEIKEVLVEKDTKIEKESGKNVCDSGPAEN